MVFLAVIIGKECQLDNTPFLSIHKFAHVSFINIFGYLTLVLFDAHVWNRETSNTFDKVNINDEACEQSQFLTAIQPVFYH